MSRSRRKRQRSASGMPLVALIALVVGLFAFFLAAEGFFYLRPHWWHWLSALAGSILGYVLGMAWYHYRGDVI